MRSRAVLFFFCIDAINSVADGQDRLMKSLDPVSNCLDWALKRRVASDSDQQLPRRAWRSLAEVRSVRWLQWPLLLLFDPLGLRSEIIVFEYDLKLVATCVVPPFFFLLLLYSGVLAFGHSLGPKNSSRVVIRLLPLYPLTIGETLETIIPTYPPRS